MEQHILERYFNNTCSPEERAKVLEWLSTEQHGEKVKEMLSTLWGNFGDEKWKHAEGHGVSFEQVKNAISELAGVPTKRSAWRRQDTWWYAAAALVGFAVTIGVLLWSDRTEMDGYLTVQTEKGERKWVTLSDGSEIYLNADSRLVYPKEMGMQHAAIYIEGEAFFDMTESDKPRVIKAGKVETTAAAGRSKFNISAFPADSVVTVAMDNGKAEVRSEYGPLMKLRDPKQAEQQDSVMPLIKLQRPKTLPLTKLRPAVKMNSRNLLVISKEGGDMDVSEAIDGRKAFGWKDGILYFDHADATSVANTLERWYGVKVNFCEGAKPEIAYTAEFDNAKLPLVLSRLSETQRVVYKQEGDDVFLCSK